MSMVIFYSYVTNHQMVNPIKSHQIPFNHHKSHQINIGTPPFFQVKSPFLHRPGLCSPSSSTCAKIANACADTAPQAVEACPCGARRWEQGMGGPGSGFNRMVERLQKNHVKIKVYKKLWNITSFNGKFQTWAFSIAMFNYQRVNNGMSHLSTDAGFHNHPQYHQWDTC